MIPADQLQVEVVYKAGYTPGGQHAGLPPQQIKVTHIPTGITAICGECRSQHRNKEVALEMIEWALAHKNVGWVK